MNFTPETHSAWSGSPPLRSGLAIERAERGTLGVALSIDGDTYFTAARHVTGPAPQAPQNVRILRSSGDYKRAPELRCLDAASEPGDSAIEAKLDLALLKAADILKNQTPDGSQPQPGFGVAATGDELQLRGCRHANWVTTSYQGDFDASHAPFFDPLPFETEHFGVIDLAPLGAAAVQQGNSGTVLWLSTTHGFVVVGHLVAVSFVKNLALVVQYRSAFDRIQLQDARVL